MLSTNANFEIVKSKDQTSSPDAKLGKELLAQRLKAISIVWNVLSLSGRSKSLRD
jgi:hypothetical protein